MFEQSVIKQTGQWAKALIALCGLIAGGAVTFVGISRLAASGRAAFLMVVGGILLAVASSLLGIAGIYCPKCKARWVWTAISKRASNEWLAWLLNKPECPSCGYPSGNRGQT
ncbi:MAG TPA: hypothetical protein VGQ36_29195 [Thermoanaerobaculia bacterium]|jgi:high-affinity Fe2+/Pb2+ permease|nr:hypothetical protein [Thermoanaerobaculia bacterium]